MIEFPPFSAVATFQVPACAQSFTFYVISAQMVLTPTKTISVCKKQSKQALAILVYILSN
jgi:hypothetical protein